jgi:hypothetical protein
MTRLYRSGFRFVPQEGERISWGFGGSGAYFVALEV